MNIGDKVRFLHGNEEGIIVKIVSDKLLEVEIEDGFTIPVARNEIVKVAQEESKHFEPEPVSPSTTTRHQPSETVLGEKGIYLAFIEKTRDILDLYIVNNTDYSLSFTAIEDDGKNTSGLGSGHVYARKSEKIGTKSLQEFERWPLLIIQALYFRSGFFKPKEPLHKRLKFKGSTFHKSKRDVPIMNTKGYLFTLDEQTKPIDIEKIRESLSEPKKGEDAYSTESEMPDSIIDLHIEKLTTDHNTLQSGEILEMQLKVFNQALDAAIASGMDEITFIHGVGNGILKNAIHEALGGYQHVQYFKDAMKSKFGYGATYVKIK
ncbi:MAG: DUF2027 domain-containing protein [Bacteroidota bacterium]